MKSFIKQDNLEVVDNTKNLDIDFATKILFIVFIAQFILLILANLFLTKYNIDADSAILFDHAIEMYNKKSFFIGGWQNTTTLEFDSALFFAFFIYGITKNIYISFGISNILMSLLYIWTIFLLSKNIGLKKVFAYIILILMFIPYRIGQLDYFNMLFFVGGQYGMKILIPLMLLTIMTLPKEKNNLTFKMIYYLFLLLSSCSSGIYVFISGIVPILACEFLYNLKDKQMTNKLSIFILSFCMVGIGTVTTILFSSDVKSFEMVLTSIYKFSDNLVKCLLGIFEVFKAIPYGEISVLSIDGIIYIYRFIFVSIILYSAIFYLKRLKSNPKYINSILAICFWNIFILILTYTTYGSKTFEYRYHLIWIVPTLILTVLRLNELMEDNRSSVGAFVSMCSIVLIGVIGLNSWYNLFTNYNNYNTLKIIAEKVEMLNANGTVFSLGNEFHEIQDNHILRLIGQKNDYLFIKSNTNEIRFFNNYKKLLDNASYSAKNVILAKPNELDKLPEYIKKEYELKGKEYIYNIYVADENKFDYISGFPSDEISRDFAYSPGYTYYNAKLNGEGYLETNGEVGLVLQSPLLSVEKLGSYDIKLNYIYNGEKNDKIGDFKLYINGKLCSQEEIQFNKNSVILDNVVIDNLNSKVQLKVFNAKDSNMILKDIEIYNKNII